MNAETSGFTVEESYLYELLICMLQMHEEDECGQ